MTRHLRSPSWYAWSVVVLGLVLFVPGVALAADGEWYQSGWMALLLGALGATYAGYIAYSMFETEAVDMDGIPVLPKYMTRKPLYLYGLLAYVGFSVIVFVALSLYYKDIYPFVRFILPGALTDVLEPKPGEPTAPVVALIVGGILYIAVLHWSSSYNPVTVLRRAIMRWASIPAATKAIRYEITERLTVPDEWRAKLTGSGGAPFVQLSHFDQRQGSPERCWAEISYLHAWILEQQRRCDRPGFFEDNQVKFDEIVNDPGGRYAQALELAGKFFKPSRSGASKNGREVGQRLGEVHECLAWLVACFLVYSNSRKVALIRAARNLGVPLSDDLVALPPVGTILLFLVSVAATAIVAIGMAAVFYDRLGAQNFDTDVIDQILGRWTLATIVLYVVPIAAVILLRYLSELVDRWTLRPHVEFYAFAALLGFVLSLGGVVALTRLFHPELQDEDVWTLAGNAWRWSLAPAVATALVALRMDPLPGTQPWRRGVRNVLVSLGFAVVLGAIVFSVMTVHPVAADGWTEEKTRAVGCAAVFAIGLVLGLLAGKGGHSTNTGELEARAA